MMHSSRADEAIGSICAQLIAPSDYQGFVDDLQRSYPIVGEEAYSACIASKWAQEWLTPGSSGA